ncbi:signal peptidase II [Oscillochloris sp. ZM17-4]|uniref:signal peptidase II n=1 Tax=Oscillochloris sp. ZM17-4 TaxID=2866714 RepID=UPI001C73A97A|nr:signal peptidase II [Oscillochloris sp. ZM17-4]MBX0330323.1 signal peptidase II [Oscillochloris sp. ZM17-4]
MSIGKHRIWAIPSLVGSLIIVADQASKAWVVQSLGPETMTRFIPVIGDTARIAYSHNTGVAFSLFQGMPQLLAFTSLAIVAGAIYFYLTQLPHRRLFVQIILGLILGGAFGNIIDRVRLGYVVDFIQVGWFPIFNLADSAITVGAALLMLQFLLEEIAHRREDRAMVLQ